MNINEILDKKQREARDVLEHSVRRRTRTTPVDFIYVGYINVYFPFFVWIFRFFCVFTVSEQAAECFGLSVKNLKTCFRRGGVEEELKAGPLTAVFSLAWSKVC